MKRLVTAAMLLAGTGLPAFATEVWQGDMFITAATTACAADGITANDFLRAVYRPRNLADNGVDTKLSLIGSRNAQRYFVANAPLTGTGNYEGILITSRANFQSWTGTFSGATVTPTPTATTQTIVVKVTFKNYGDIVGCTATLKGSLGHRP